MVKQWLLGAYGFTVAVIFCPHISGAAISPRWMALAIIPWLFLRTPPKIRWDTIGFLVPFLIWIYASLLWTAQIYDGANEAIEWTIAIGVFLLGASVEKPRLLYLGFGIGIILSYPFGLYAPNPDLVGEAAAVSLVALVATFQWGQSFTALLIPCVGTVLILSHSRGGILGVCCAASIAAFYRSWKLGALVTISGIVLVGTLVYLGDIRDSTERINIWQDTIAGITLFGHGLGSFRYMFPDYASHINIIQGTRPDHAHNDLLEILFETGINGGILALGLLIVLYKAQFAEALIVICVLGIGITNFPLHIPSTLFLAAFALGRICRLDYLFNTANEGGILLCPELFGNGGKRPAKRSADGTELPSRI